MPSQRHSSYESSRERGKYERDQHVGRLELPDRDRKRPRNPRRSTSAEDRYQERRRDRHSYGDRKRTSRSRSPIRQRRSPDRRHRSHSPKAPVRHRGPLPSQENTFRSAVTSKRSSPAPEKEKPNFSNTGRLATESNTVMMEGGSVVLKYHEPPEARKPPAKDAWRLYVFKGSDLLEIVELGERSCWLVGREKLVVDFPIEHPSCSKQHAAVQFRYLEKRNEFGDRQGRVRPYLIDLESANGSTVNGELVPTGRYVELQDKDVLRFGLSTREYVLMLPPAD
ncbi:SMAD/FHA domain containing protein [Elaphomyces granulatus]